MIYLALAILCSTFINLVFRFLKGKDVHLNIVLAFNYVACVCTSLVIERSDSILFQPFWNEKWFTLTALLGVVFIIIFTYMALTAQKMGVSVSATASRMGVVFPVLFGYFYWKEDLDWVALIGIVLGLVSVYLISAKSKGFSKVKLSNILFPIIIFVGSGFIDTALNYLKESLLGSSPEIHPTTIIFLFAGITGLVAFGRSLVKESPRRMLKNAGAGILLGVPNFFSIFYLLKAINSGELQSVIIFPINNISIMLFSTIAAVIIFREHLNKRNQLGLVMATLAIALISLSHAY